MSTCEVQAQVFHRALVALELQAGAGVKSVYRHASAPTEAAIHTCRPPHKHGTTLVDNKH